MRIIRGLQAISPDAKHAVLALGNFDGVHRGHGAVLAAAKAEARKRGVPFGVMTFEPHPRRVFSPQLPPLRLIPFAEKARQIRFQGADYLFVIRFTNEFSKVTASAFAQDILQGALKVSHVVTGENFSFGYNREGTSEMLGRLAAAGGFGYTACPSVKIAGQVCSSSRIRGMLSEGRLHEAESLLGRPYEISGPIRHGDARGRELGFPTANLAPGNIWLPALGVYAVRARFDRESEQWHDAVANLGQRPTFGEKNTMLEVHFLAMTQDMYQKRLRVKFVSYLRPEKKFPDAAALKEQIARDIVQAQGVLSGEAE